MKLLDIWERGQTFPFDMLAGFKQQLNANKTSTLYRFIQIGLLLTLYRHSCACAPKPSTKEQWPCTICRYSD